LSAFAKAIATKIGILTAKKNVVENKLFLVLFTFRMLLFSSVVGLLLATHLVRKCYLFK